MRPTLRTFVSNSSRLHGFISKATGAPLVRSGFLGLSLALGTMLSSAMVPTVSQAATDVQGIAAIVNDAIISRYDLDQRVQLVMATSGIQPTPENLERIREQVLRSLIDEKLQLQEAERLEIEVSEEELDTAVDGISQRAGMTREQILEYLEGFGVGKTALYSQIHADTAWNKVISARFAPLVQIGDDEVNEIMHRIEQDAEQVQYQLAELYLGFDNPAQEREMSVGAQRLVEQMRVGAPFSAVAQQFSQAASAANGGDIGWVAESQLPTEIAAVVAGMSVGAVSDPIRTHNGFYIMQLRSKREGLGPNPLNTQLSIIQVVLALSPDAPEAQAQARARQADQLRQQFRTCAALPDQVAKIQGAEASPQTTVTAAQIRDPLRTEILKHEAGTFVPAGRTPRGIEAIVICDRKDDLGNAPDFNAIENNLFNQGVSMMARRHLRDLKRDAVIEMR